MYQENSDRCLARLHLSKKVMCFHLLQHTIPTDEPIKEINNQLRYTFLNLVNKFEQIMSISSILSSKILPE